MTAETSTAPVLVNVQINGVWHQFPKGTRLIEACEQAGSYIPRYCYHKKLSAPGNCRMCLIEMGLPKMGPDRKPALDEEGKPVINWMPRPQISCAQDVSEGMGVRTDSPLAQECRKGVMEFLLINHPLDCPICDQAGECKLQEYSVEYGQAQSRFVEPNFWRDPVSGNGFQIQVEIPQNRVRSIEDLKGLRLSSEGHQALLRDVADVRFGTTMGEVDRYNMQRVVSLTANLHGEYLGDGAKQIQLALRRVGNPPRGITVAVRGQIPPLEETISGLRIGLLLSILVIFLLLTFNFQSLRLALTILLTVPAVLCGVLMWSLYRAPAVNVGFAAGMDADAVRRRLWNVTMNGQYPGSGSAAWFDFISASRHWDLEPYFDVDGGRALALEDVDEHLQLLGVRVDVDDLAVEVGERAGRHLDRLAERELGLRLRGRGARGACGVQDAVDLDLRQRHGLRARADEAGHAGCAFHDRPCLVAEIHVDEHVARKHALLDLHLLSVLRLDHLLGRHDDAPEAGLLVHRDDAVLEVGLDLVLVARIRVDHIPVEHRNLTAPEGRRGRRDGESGRRPIGRRRR
jgi:hypothetical protein